MTMRANFSVTLVLCIATGFGQTTKVAQSPLDPLVKAESAIVVEGRTGHVLWAKNPDQSRFPASTTKMLTALLVIEHCSLTDVITAPADIETVKEASLHLKPGEQVNVRDMLHAILLRSANDACYAAALHVSGSIPAFVSLMNQRARQLGCTNTHFNNTNGLMDPLHTTTARDLATIGREAMKNPTFAEIVRKRKFTISRSINWADTKLTNHNKLLAKDPTVDGIKTGYTEPAGNCFVGRTTRDGVSVIVALMKSDKISWQSDYQTLTSWAFKNCPKTNLVIKNPVHQETLADGSKLEVRFTESVQAMMPASSTGVVNADFQLDPAVGTKPIRTGDRVGKWILADESGMICEVPARAFSVKSPPILKSVTSKASFSYLALASVLGGLGYFVRRRASRLVSK